MVVQTIICSWSGAFDDNRWKYHVWLRFLSLVAITAYLFMLALPRQHPEPFDWFEMNLKRAQMDDILQPKANLQLAFHEYVMLFRKGHSAHPLSKPILPGCGAVLEKGKHIVWLFLRHSWNRESQINITEVATYLYTSICKITQATLESMQSNWW